MTLILLLIVLQVLALAGLLVLWVDDLLYEMRTDRPGYHRRVYAVTVRQ
ncbi:hypothetical protein ACFYS8_13270 [Kitasatospora sp. NPDC004615]